MDHKQCLMLARHNKRLAIKTANKKKIKDEAAAALKKAADQIKAQKLQDTIMQKRSQELKKIITLTGFEDVLMQLQNDIIQRHTDDVTLINYSAELHYYYRPKHSHGLYLRWFGKEHNYAFEKLQHFVHHTAYGAEAFGAYLEDYFYDSGFTVSMTLDDSHSYVDIKVQLS
jgi:hypothetical protein